MNLIKDFNNNIKLINNRKIISIFIGGGTPSLFNPHSLHILLQYIKNNSVISKNAEVTIEINPFKINTINIKKYKNLGINRISLGIQSFNLYNLQNLSRTHDIIDIASNINAIISVNYISYNFDILYGLPNQNYMNSIHDLKTAISFSPPHISWYQLIPPTDSFLKDYNFYIPSEDILWKIYFCGKKILKLYGYHQYEISSYAKDRHISKHNLNYCCFGDYIGIGSGACSKISFKNGKILRIQKTKNVDDYLSGNFIDKKYYLSKKDKIIEFFINRFRLYTPIPKEDFINYTGLSLSYIKKPINLSIKNGFLLETKLFWKTTYLGKLFYNDLVMIFIENCYL
uniref:Heme chaperone HemW n=1 Tax=Candidatus Aschnera chinzeii TaxID=1485666 RepID=A0AAT9G433_9ENTR|nr:MAG: radical SAM family heme chaperone HemW [Candidatus Aschnera chinzeii]